MPSPLPPAADRFASIVGALCRFVGERHWIFAPAMTFLVWVRLRRMVVRLSALAERVRRGERMVARRRSAVSAVARVRPAVGLPRRFGWLLGLGTNARCYGGQLAHLLTDPEMVALIAAAPGMGRVLRPLCRMLGVELIAELRILPRVAEVRAAEMVGPVMVGPEMGASGGSRDRAAIAPVVRGAGLERRRPRFRGGGSVPGLVVAPG